MSIREKKVFIDFEPAFRNAKLKVSIAKNWLFRYTFEHSIWHITSLLADSAGTQLRFCIQTLCLSLSHSFSYFLSFRSANSTVTTGNDARLQNDSSLHLGNFKNWLWWQKILPNDSSRFILYFNKSTVWNWNFLNQCWKHKIEIVRW